MIYSAVAQFGVRHSESGVCSLPRLVSVAPHCLRVASVQGPESVHTEEPDQLRMSDLEFGRLSGGLVHSRSENDAEWEGTDVLSEQREIGVKLEMENERWLERTNRSDLEHTETSPDSISLDSHHSPLLTPPHSQHLAVPDSPSPLSPALHTPSPSQHKSESHSQSYSNHGILIKMKEERHLAWRNKKTIWTTQVDTAKMNKTDLERPTKRDKSTKAMAKARSKRATRWMTTLYRVGTKSAPRRLFRCCSNRLTSHRRQPKMGYM
ncbi:hypothetical protein BLNAU_21023 [Blattamonas nauphoetae]|uniref:Uncharacterized protein n=1 Tax=Blattamonas nauphoetae TaxID=2049346 RepID=A0ABQ9WX43_9EUKA|nr:hypothetical protein BLNAU_21023 [Blattamonas nauphoetae]